VDALAPRADEGRG